MAYFHENRTYSAAGLIQWTDIEAECDGLLNYDRSPKFSDAEAKLIRDMNAKLVEPPVACTDKPPASGSDQYPPWMKWSG